MKIRIVKKNTVKIDAPDVISAKSTREAAREMVSTMSEWVTDFKSRKGVETKAAIERFLPPRPQTSGS